MRIFTIFLLCAMLVAVVYGQTFENDDEATLTLTRNKRAPDCKDPIIQIVCSANCAAQKLGPYTCINGKCGCSLDDSAY